MWPEDVRNSLHNTEAQHTEFCKQLKSGLKLQSTASHNSKKEDCKRVKPISEKYPVKNYSSFEAVKINKFTGKRLLWRAVSRVTKRCWTEGI